MTWNDLLHKTVHIKGQNFFHTYFFFEVDLISILNFSLIKPESNSVITRYPSSVNINIATQGDLLCVDWCHLDVLLWIYLLPLLLRKVFIFLSLGCYDYFLYIFTTVLCMILLQALSDIYFEFSYPMFEIYLNNRAPSDSSDSSFASRASNLFPLPQHVIAPVVVGIFPYLHWYLLWFTFSMYIFAYYLYWKEWFEPVF